MALTEARPFLITAAVLLGACLWLGWWIPAALAALLLAFLLLFSGTPPATLPLTLLPWSARQTVR